MSRDVFSRSRSALLLTTVATAVAVALLFAVRIVL